MIAYATCPRCRRTMEPGNAGCTDAVWCEGGEHFPPVLFGAEPNADPRLVACPDCNVRRGASHHHGCDTEACGPHRRQALGCELCTPLEHDPYATPVH